jgi:hypothetical protein
VTAPAPAPAAVPVPPDESRKDDKVEKAPKTERGGRDN